MFDFAAIEKLCDTIESQKSQVERLYKEWRKLTRKASNLSLSDEVSEAFSDAAYEIAEHIRKVPVSSLRILEIRANAGL
jgi:hypothetical protein